jgi:hypothetical protein
MNGGEISRFFNLFKSGQGGGVPAKPGSLNQGSNRASRRARQAGNSKYALFLKSVFFEKITEKIR